MKYKTFTNGIKSFNDEEMIIEHYITTSTPDRYGDVINPKGMDTKNFRKNPVVLFCHDSKSMVIGKNISLITDEFGIRARTQFANTNAGKEIYRLNREGFLNAWSIGFIPRSKPRITKIDGMEVNIIDKWELLEYSSVPVPANPDSINLILKNLTTENNSRNKNINHLNERNKKMEENQLKNTETLDESKVESISKKVATDIIKKEIGSLSNLVSSQIPSEGYRESSNRENKIIQDGRNLLRSIVYGKPELLPAEYKDFLNETDGGLGGYLVPQEWYDKIFSLVNKGGVAMRNATVYNMSRRELVIPKLDNIPTWSFVTEGTVKPVSNPSFAQVILRRKDGGFIVLFSKQLLEDEVFDLMGFVTGLAAQILAYTIDTAAFRGYDGQIDGILTFRCRGISKRALRIPFHRFKL